MTRTTRTFTKTDTLTRHSFNATAYTDDGGRTWRWESNNAYCPLSSCRDFGIPADLQAQDAALTAEARTFFAAYRRMQRGRRPSAEHRAELRAAFGPGVVVVDVISGRRTRT